jgi:hypothetical protein
MVKIPTPAATMQASATSPAINPTLRDAPTRSSPTGGEVGMVGHANASVSPGLACQASLTGGETSGGTAGVFGGSRAVGSGPEPPTTGPEPPTTGPELEAVGGSETARVGAGSRDAAVTGRRSAFSTLPAKSPAQRRTSGDFMSE